MTFVSIYTSSHLTPFLSFLLMNSFYKKYRDGMEGSTGHHHHHSHNDHGGGLGIAHQSLSEPSSPESNFDDSDLFSSTITDDVTAQLVAAGTVGVAAAAAIATGRKRKRPHIFETNPSIRKRQQTRLLRKLRNTIEEYTARVGQQAIILTCMPGKPNQSSLAFKVFGSQPLENVVRNSRNKIMQELESALSSQTPILPESSMNANLHELPALQIDGIPTPLDKMTQAQLRAFIPEMLKFSTGRSKPGWGKSEYRPIWWPIDVPWANVRSDVRSDDLKRKVSWTHALKTVVRNCYRHHGREDLLPHFADDNPNQITLGPHSQTMLQTISNPDGSLSIIQIDPGDNSYPQIFTLPDGTQAQIIQTQLGQSNVVGDGTNLIGEQMMVSGVDLSGTEHGSTYANASFNADGQIVLSGDGSSLNGLVSIPMSMYQKVVGSLSGQGIHVLTTTSFSMEQQNCPALLANLTGNLGTSQPKLENNVPLIINTDGLKFVRRPGSIIVGSGGGSGGNNVIELKQDREDDVLTSDDVVTSSPVEVVTIAGPSTGVRTHTGTRIVRGGGVIYVSHPGGIHAEIDEDDDGDVMD